MNIAEARATLAELEKPLRALLEVLQAEVPEDVRYWTGLVAECDELLASSDLTSDAVQAFGDEVGRRR